MRYGDLNLIQFDGIYSTQEISAIVPSNDEQKMVLFIDEMYILLSLHTFLSVAESDVTGYLSRKERRQRPADGNFHGKAVNEITDVVKLIPLGMHCGSK